jgi:large subunit ribosomal protein L21
MSYAILKTGGKQYKVSTGDQINVEKLDLKVGDKATFGEVLMVSSGGKVTAGTPFLSGAKVEGEVVDQIKDEKVLAFKYKRRKGYHRSVGHRRKLTTIKINSITGA